MKKIKYKYDYPKNREIGEKIMHGEGKLISQLTKLSKSYVSDVLSGKKNNKTIIGIAEELIASRELLTEKHK